jgi:hypothetical protein
VLAGDSPVADEPEPAFEAALEEEVDDEEDEEEDEVLDAVTVASLAAGTGAKGLRAYPARWTEDPLVVSATG